MGERMAAAAGSGKGHGSLVSTPFVASWIGRARDGDRTHPDTGQRAAAWAHWAATNLTLVSGRDREYAAVWLDGQFHDPRGEGPRVRPHLELADRVLAHPDPWFPDRLAIAGNGLLFPWWKVSEVTAVKRAVVTSKSGDPHQLVAALERSRNGLVGLLRALTEAASSRWSEVERLLVTSPDGLMEEATGDFPSNEVADLLPALKGADVSVSYDPRLREKNQQWASRRVGVWRVTSPDVALGAVTPRLTASSTIEDPTFAPEREGLLALLVRCLLLRRLITIHLDVDAAAWRAGEHPGETGGGAAAPAGSLKASAPREGGQFPSASTDAAVAFLQAYPSATDAWEALRRWAGDRYELAVGRDAFLSAHRRAYQRIRRAEDPARDDIDALLPPAWSGDRVVRVTFSRAPRRT